MEWFLIKIFISVLCAVLAIALAIGLISALTGKDIVGDLNSGLIIDGNGLGGIIGGSGSFTESGSSPSTSGNVNDYLPQGTYSKTDFDIKYVYEEIEGCSSVVLEFCVPHADCFYDVSFFLPGSGDNFPCIYNYDLADGSDGNTATWERSNGRWEWISKSSSVRSGTFSNVVPDSNGFIRFAIKHSTVSGLTDDGIVQFVESVMNSAFTLTVKEVNVG